MLTTVDAVIECLGGTFRAAELAGVGPPAVSNWKARGRFPADQYLNITKALDAVKATCDPVLFGMARTEAAE